MKKKKSISLFLVKFENKLIGYVEKVGWETKSKDFVDGYVAHLILSKDQDLDKINKAAPFKLHFPRVHYMDWFEPKSDYLTWSRGDPSSKSELEKDLIEVYEALNSAKLV